MIHCGHASLKQTSTGHRHSDHELVICMSDAGRHRIDQDDHDFQLGKLFFLPEQLPHHVICTDNDLPVELVYICFDHHYFSQHSLPALQHAVQFRLDQQLYATPQSDHDREANVLIGRRIIEELNSPSSFQEATFHSLLCDLIIRQHKALGIVDDEERPHFQTIKQFCQSLQTRLESEMSLEEAANSIGMSRTLFASVFRQVTGSTYLNYVTKLKIDKARKLLAQSDESIEAIAKQAGFHHMGHFHTKFKAELNMTPRKYRLWSRNQEGALHLKFN